MSAAQDINTCQIMPRHAIMRHAANAQLEMSAKQTSIAKCCLAQRAEPCHVGPAGTHHVQHTYVRKMNRIRSTSCNWNVSGDLLDKDPRLHLTFAAATSPLMPHSGCPKQCCAFRCMVSLPAPNSPGQQVSTGHVWKTSFRVRK
jgi:hypothetical protein